MAGSSAARSLPLLLAGLLLLLGAAAPQDADNTPLCERPGCRCEHSTASCDFKPDQVVRLGAASLASGSPVSEVSLSGARELQLLPGALSGARLLRRLRVRAVGKAVLRRGALAAYAEPHAILEVSDCGTLVLESQASRGLRGALMALVARCAHVVVQAGAFARLLALTVAHVPHLQLASSALAVDISAGQPTLVNLTHVLVPELPPHAFPSSAVAVRLQDCEVRVVQPEAFSALEMGALSVVNSSLHDVAAAAFSPHTLVDQLLFSGARVHRLRRGALLAAVTNLTIQHCTIDEVESGAVNNTVAVATLRDNRVGLVRERGFVLRKWNRLRIINNTFDDLREDAIWAPHLTVADAPVSELVFSQNRVGRLPRRGLSWLGAAAAGVGAATAADNELVGTACGCDLAGDAGWVSGAVLCRPPTPLLGRCLLPASSALAHGQQPATTLSNFTEAACVDGSAVVCEDAPAVLANADGEESGRRSSLLLSLLLGLSLCAAAAVGGGAWLRRKRRRRLPACLAALLSRRLESAPAPAPGPRQAGDGSPGHEYAELQPHQQPQQVPDDVALLPAEDKWTQTLPEELTQELLQALRDKLDDPDNYSEARDMIEHLYDLIKVEESGAEERETGEVIRRPAARGATRSTGTRAPSPPPPGPVRVCGDYLEPRDRSPAQQHLYAELPAATATATALCEYAEPRDSQQHVYCELPPPLPISERPLPSTPAQR